MWNATSFTKNFADPPRNVRENFLSVFFYRQSMVGCIVKFQSFVTREFLKKTQVIRCAAEHVLACEKPEHGYFYPAYCRRHLHLPEQHADKQAFAAEDAEGLRLRHRRGEMEVRDGEGFGD